MDNEKITLTRSEYNTALDVAATKAIIKRIDIDSRKQTENTNGLMTELNTRLIALAETINTWPERLNSCRDSLKSEIHNDLKEFMTHKDGELMEQRLESKVTEVNTKIKTNTIIIVSVAGIIQFGLTVAVLVVQLSKLTASVPIP